MYRLPFFWLVLLVISVRSSASGNAFSVYFQQAYLKYPAIPKGLLEAVAWHQTRLCNIDSTEMPSCSGMPAGYGIMGLVTDGKNYFKNTAVSVARFYNVNPYQAAVNAEMAVNGYAVLLNSKVKAAKQLSVDWSLWFNAVRELSEIPSDGNPVNELAQELFIWELVAFLNNSDRASEFGFTVYAIDAQSLFGSNYSLLSSRKIIFSQQGITDEYGNYFMPKKINQKSAQYGPAIWNPAPSCNYSSRSGTPVSAITIHTVQGTYAGAISWAQNCNSSVSYHYVVRSSDGQITQMVDEANKAWHVGSENPYTVGYEHEGYVSSPTWYTLALYTASANLSRDITNSGYGINPLRTYYGSSSSGTQVLGSCTKIKGHQHYPNQTHTDPGIYWDWEKYYQLINNTPSVTTVSSSGGNFYDTGGPSGNYSDDERCLWLFSPTGASSVTLSFSQFNIETNWDYLFIYDGNSVSSPLIGVYTGTNSPGTVSSTGPDLLVEFRSDCNTISSGWSATYVSTNPQPADVTPPSTAVTVPSTWITQNFTASFSDVDNSGGSGIEKSFYQCTDNNAGEWRSNSQKGFFKDNFDQVSVHADWTLVTGNWILNNGALQQTDDTQGNTNIYAFVNQSLSNRYLYHWTGRMSGAGTNRRAGLHYFCDAPTLTNRGNSYFVWFRLDDDEIQLYKVVNDVFTLVASTSFNFTVGQWYDYKLIYDRIAGNTWVYIDNVLKLTWTDSAPYSSGNYVSFRSGNSVYDIDNFQVFRSRNASVAVSVDPAGDLRYQNQNPYTPAGRIQSLTSDVAGNISSVTWQDVNVDTTVPSLVSGLNDGLSIDTDTFYTNTILHANWNYSLDTQSAIARYWYCIGTTPGGTEVAGWTDNAWYDTLTRGGLSLTYGNTYFVTLKAENGAGLQSAITISDGMYLAIPTAQPQAVFQPAGTIVCSTDSVYFTNTSLNATTYQWLFPGGTPSSSSLASPAVYYPSSGMYIVTLVASGPGGSDTLSMSVTVTVHIPPQAMFSVSNDTVTLPNAMVGFTNLSQNADGFAWYFGDGNFSNGTSPWNVYTSTGWYLVTLIASAGGCANDTSQTTIVVLGGSSVQESNTSVFSIYPNPASTHVTIRGNLSNSQIRIHDATGRLIFIQPVTMKTSLVELDLPSLAAGYYSIVIKTESGTFVNRMMVW